MKRILIAAFLLTACSKKTSGLPDAGLPPKDSGVEVDAGVETDSGVEPDSGVETDAGSEPVRELIEYSLFGTSPRDNLVVSPEFDLYTSAWFGISLDFRAYADVTRYYFADTPTRQPALAFSSPNGAFLLGSVRSTSGPLSISVWIGYDGTIDARVTALASFLGTSASGADVAFDLSPDESTRFESNGRVWIRYWGVATEAPVGIANLYIEEASLRRTYVTGPVVVPMSTTDLGTHRLELRTKLRDGERRALDEFHRRLRDNLGAPPPRMHMR